MMIMLFDHILKDINTVRAIGVSAHLKMSWEELSVRDRSLPEGARPIGATPVFDWTVLAAVGGVLRKSFTTIGRVPCPSASCRLIGCLTWGLTRNHWSFTMNLHEE